YDSNAGMDTDYHPMFAENQLITVVGRPWKLGFTTLPDFGLSVDHNQPIVVGAAGVLISLLLSGVTFVLANNQALADSRADRMTATVRENARKLRRQNDFLAALQATRLGLLSHQRLEDTLHQIVERAAELAGTRHGYLFQREPDGDEMVMRVGTGFFEQRVGDRIKPGQSVAGVAWHTGQPAVVNDYPNWPGRVPSPIFDQLTSLAGVPLKVGDQVVGVIGLGYVQGDAGSFAEDDMMRLAQIGELASLALENAQLFNQAETELSERTKAQSELRKAYDELELRIEERTAELRTLNQISLVINEQSDAADIAREVGEQLRHIFHTDNAYIALYDGQSNLISFPYVVRQGHIEKIKPLAFGPGMVSRILRTTQALILRADAQQPPVDFEAELMGVPVGTYVGVPIMAGDEALGVIGVQGGEGEGTLAESDVRLLTTIAANVGVALGRSKLLQEAQQRARQEYLARSIVTQISNSVDPSTILQATARQLSHALGASHAVIRIGAPTNAPDGRGESHPASSSD
ncbi:MAG: GAF domain-containing protein, partial [Chloroflexi bacterium]